MIAEIDEAQRLRGWILNSHAQVEFSFGDLLLRCRKLPEYADKVGKFTHSGPERAKRVRRLLQARGPLDTFAPDLGAIVDEFEQGQELRNLLAHGLCEYLHTGNGDCAIQFQKWHRQEDREDGRIVRAFRLKDLIEQEEIAVSFARKAMALFYQMHSHFGWVARSDF